ncbi:MAG: hypothetical protein RIE08_15750 [Acidimicrobiales bacterium]
MTKRNPFLLLVALLAALALVAAACGDDDADVGVGGDDTSDQVPGPGDEAALPVADDESLPPAAGACLEGTVDCNDTPGDLEGPELEPGDESVEPVTGMLADGGLSPEEALAMGPAAGVIAVTGFILDDATGTYLCGALAESYPPQCGAGAIELQGFALEMVAAPFTVADGVTWTDTPVSVFGVVVNGVMTVDEAVTG